MWTVLKKSALITHGNDKPAMAPALFRPIDTPRIARDFKIEVVARDRGRHNLPMTQENAFDAFEQKIVQKVEEEWTSQSGELLNNLRTHADRLVSCSIPGEVLRLQIQAEHVLAWLRVATSQALRGLTPLQERYLGARDELNDFRNRNHLSRPAQEFMRVRTTFALLLILVAVESVFSSLLFAKDSIGPVGHVETAIVISLINVALAFLLGLGPVRWRNHRDFVISTSGLLATFSGIASIGALHLFAAHLRVSIMLVTKGEVFAAALEATRKTPWALPDMVSLYFIGMGLVFALGAAWKGYSFDDRYPRYGATYRREKSALEKYRDAYSDLFDELTEAENDAIIQLNDGIAKLPKFRQMAVEVRARRAAMLNNFRAYESSVETATNQLLKLYRDINHAQRTTAPPSYFDETWGLQRSFLLSPDLKPLLADPEMGDIASSVAELEQLAKAIITRHGLLLERYPHPSEMN
jgi:hypothetical protein